MNKSKFKFKEDKVLKQANKYTMQTYTKVSNSTVVVSEVGEYSIFVKKNLENIKQLHITTKKMPTWIESTEILSSPEGSIIYFKEYVKDTFKSGCIYPVRFFKPAYMERNDLNILWDKIVRTYYDN